MNEGFITLHRRILDWEWYDNIPVKILFLHCLLKANHKTNNWRGSEIKRGQFITSTKKLSEETGLTTKQVITALKKLEKTNELDKQTTNVNTLISVVNYDFYQSEGKPKTNEGQTKDKRRATNNNDNNDNNENNTKADEIDFDALLAFINETFGRNFKTISNQVKSKYNARLKDGYGKSDFKTAMVNCSKLQFHKDNNFQYCTPEYFSRSEILDKYSAVSNNGPIQDLRITDPDADIVNYVNSHIAKYS